MNVAATLKENATSTKISINPKDNTVTMQFELEDSFNFNSVPKSDKIKFFLGDNIYYVNSFCDVLTEVMKYVGLENIYKNHNFLSNKKKEIPFIIRNDDCDGKYKEYFDNTVLNWKKFDNFRVNYNWSGSDTLKIVEKIINETNLVFNICLGSLPERLKWDDNKIIEHLKNIKNIKSAKMFETV